ncbi:MAG TPA: hypothetical protein VEK38_04300 [Candidatus Bathyarchaeia archaeon]|nr:hypothetical protein [Candidatus Bathyarchaeia archaeon]
MHKRKKYKARKISGYLYIGIGALIILMALGNLILRLIIACGGLILINYGVYLLIGVSMYTFLRPQLLARLLMWEWDNR